MAFCEPSGCGIAPLPMKSPSLISAIDAFTTATTSILSARLSVSASPLSDFAVTLLPSTFSITPRKRTVCGACASAAVAASAATTASAARIAAILMSGLQVGRSHRRRGQRSVLRFLRGNDDELRARLEIGWAAGFELHHRRVRRNDDLFLAVRIFDHDGLAVDAGNGRLDVGVGHGATGLAIPRAETRRHDTLLRIHEDVKADRLLAAVRLRHRRDSD